MVSDNHHHQSIFQIIIIVILDSSSQSIGRRRRSNGLSWATAWPELRGRPSVCGTLRLWRYRVSKCLRPTDWTGCLVGMAQHLSASGLSMCDTFVVARCCVTNDSHQMFPTQHSHVQKSNIRCARAGVVVLLPASQPATPTDRPCAFRYNLLYHRHIVTWSSIRWPTVILIRVSFIVLRGQEQMHLSGCVWSGELVDNQEYYRM